MRAWLSFLMLPVTSAWAEQAETSIPAVDPVSGSYLVKITLGLAFIIALIFVLAWLMKKLQLAPQSGHPLIRIVSAISVGQRDRIALVEVGDEQILIGLTPGRIEKLHTMNTPVKVPEHVQAEGASFSERFNRLMPGAASARDSKEARREP